MQKYVFQQTQIRISQPPKDIQNKTLAMVCAYMGTTL